MTGAEIITKFINMVEDELDTDYMYELLNDAKNEVEDMRSWEVLKATTSFTGTSWSFSAVNFRYPLALLETGYIEYSQIPLEDYYRYKDSSYLYYINWSAKTLNIVNSGDVGTKYLTYSVFTADINSTGEWIFPDRFHSIIPLKMAELYYASDAGEKSRAWDDRWASQFERMLGRMETWDSMLKVRGRKSQRGTNYNPKAINV